MAKEELFRNPLFGALLRRLNAFPVRRGTADRTAVKRSLELLRKGWALVMFPEGTRSETGDLQQPEIGVGMMAYRSGAPVVPVHVAGTERVMPRGGRLRLARVSVDFGPAVRFEAPPGGARPGHAEYEEAARRIMAAIAALRDARRLREGDPPRQSEAPAEPPLAGEGGPPATRRCASGERE
jgi:1-acyl-sn-glycerol-3-phosphate acyltransferase